MEDLALCTTHIQPEPECAVYSPEVNLHKHVVCSKNPGHARFIPITKFKKNHLPGRYRRYCKMDFIRSMAELTFHVKVRAVSTDRPVAYPGSDYPYPFHKSGGGSQYRTGSGFVWNITKCGECPYQVCECSECESSSNPKKTWWKLSASTALHVVYDDFEVKDAELKFFYDRVDSETFVTHGHSIFKPEYFDYDVDSDLCMFTVAIHDKDVGERLENALDSYWKFKPLRVHNAPVVIVSHPHGCPKHVTIGKQVKRKELPNGETCIIYTASTCPGCSGGAVISLQESWGYNWRHHYQACLHSGALGNGKHRSGEWRGLWN